MDKANRGILPKNYLLNDKYTVLLFIKQGSNAETYRVKGNDGILYFLKLFNYSKLHRSAFDAENNLLEIEFLKKVSHENIVSFKDSGELIYDGKKYGFLVLNFIAGETLSEKMSRESYSFYYDVKQIITDVLQGLEYLHGLPEPIIHNEITPQNIMLDLSGDIPKAILIDFGYARSFHQSTKAYNKEGLNLNYVASECFNGLYSPQSDVFSVGAVLFQMVFGMPPWSANLSKFQAEKISAMENVIQARKNKLFIHKASTDFIGYNANFELVIKKALYVDTENRFNTAIEFIQALNGEIEVEDIDKVPLKGSVINPNLISKKSKIGNGFADIAGMNELKELLTIDVINALRNPEEYKRYGISFPNGILFYGPPRCGKTFFAKKFAEEVGHNYIYIKPSTLKSKWVNATQENIAKMFEEAEKNAPTIIFIDEINELVPNRENDAHEMTKSAVNEMLAQMDRTGDKGIFVIGATNYPQMIDPAILGAGRLEKKFYIGPPDFDLRKSLFQNYLKNKPLDFGIDYDKLSNLTENYVTGDIELLSNEAAKKAMLNKQRISMEILEFTIKNQRPTVSFTELKKFENIKQQIELGLDLKAKKEIPRVGF